ncbi:MAG: sulfotransferase family 2 domain-containing protein [Mycobacterium sp.]|nr:sulfotransferase family 2 domain-containing protein [Mycobacterium sp.]
MNIRARLYGPATKVLPATFFEKRSAQLAQDDYRRAGICFIHVPRTAGLSVIRAVYGSDMLRHFTNRQLLKVSSEDVRRLPRFSIVRNPWDRAVSAYMIAKQGGVPGGAQMLHPEQYQQPEFTTFDRFVREYLATHDPRKLDGVFKPQTYYLGPSNIRRDEALDHVGHFDRLNETEAWLSDNLGRNIHLEERTNATRHEPYGEYYDNVTRDLVERIYRDDIERFGFEFQQANSTAS